MRIALGIEYNGRGYHGWQTQRNGLAVQTVLEQAISRVADHPVALHCAGRTDTGVHATGQVVHFDTESIRPQRAWTLGVNSYLPADIAVTWMQPVSDQFHARFQALRRRYRYIILNQNLRSAVLAQRVTQYHKWLDVAAMQIAAQYLLGQHDFSAFRAAECQAKTPIRQIFSLDIWRQQRYIYFDIIANAFLQHMVRNIVGVLLPVGTAEKPTAWVQQVLQSCDRRQAGVTAPPDGLYLTQVIYAPHWNIPPAAYQPLF